MIISRYKLNTSENREGMAKYISSIIERGKRCDSLPYKPNENDDYFWTLDSGNDWKVKFFEDSLLSFEIVHRYNNQKATYALSLWIAYRIGASFNGEQVDSLLSIFRRYQRGCRNHPSVDWSEEIVKQWEEDRVFYLKTYNNSTQYISFGEAVTFAEEQLFLKCCGEQF